MESVFPSDCEFRNLRADKRGRPPNFLLWILTILALWTGLYSKPQQCSIMWLTVEYGCGQLTSVSPGKLFSQLPNRVWSVSSKSIATWYTTTGVVASNFYYRIAISQIWDSKYYTRLFSRMNFRDIVYPVGVLLARSVISILIFHVACTTDIPMEEPRIITNISTKTGQTAPASPKRRRRKGKGGIQKQEKWLTSCPFPHILPTSPSSPRSRPATLQTSPKTTSSNIIYTMPSHGRNWALSLSCGPNITAWKMSIRKSWDTCSRRWRRSLRMALPTATSPVWVSWERTDD